MNTLLLATALMISQTAEPPQVPEPLQHKLAESPRKLNCQCGVGCVCPGTEGGDCLCHTDSDWNVFNFPYQDDGGNWVGGWFVVKFPTTGSYPVLQGKEYPYRNRESAQQEADWRNNPLVKSGEAWYVSWKTTRISAEWAPTQITPLTADKYKVFADREEAQEEADRRNQKSPQRQPRASNSIECHSLSEGVTYVSPPSTQYRVMAQPFHTTPCPPRQQYAPPVSKQPSRAMQVKPAAHVQYVSSGRTQGQRPFGRQKYPQAPTPMYVAPAGINFSTIRAPARERAWITAAPNVARQNTSSREAPRAVAHSANAPRYSLASSAGCVGRG